MKSIALLSSSLYFCFNPISAAGGSGWEYDEGEYPVGKWAEYAEECGGMQQSPIDVIFYDDYSVACDEPLTLEWTSETMSFAVQNAGLSLKATPFQFQANGGGDLSSLEVLHHTNDTNIRLPNQFYNTYTSPYNKEYCFDSLHFHWGRNDSEGSEHTYNGQKYPLEVHFVHYSCDYLLLGPAVGDYVSGKVKEDPYDDQHILAVIGVVFEIGDPNPVLEAMLDDLILDGIREYHDPSSRFGDHLLELYYTEFDMNGLIPDNKEFLAYKGSLTTPPCLETVRWHNMKTPMTVSERQMEKFRSLSSSMSLNDSQAPNYRPPQTRWGRQIYQCKEDVEAEYVEKEEVDTSSSSGGGGSDDEATTSSSSSSEGANAWTVVAVIFIILFVIILIGIIYLYRVAYGGQSQQDPSGQYQKTYQKSIDPENTEEFVE